MVKRKLFVAALVTFVSIDDANAQYACASAHGLWSSGYASWDLTQGSGGAVWGELLSNKPTGPCPGARRWGVTGTLINGQLDLTAAYSGPLPRPVGCAHTIWYTAALQKPGCNTASVTWSNSGGDSGAITWGAACKVPTSETSPTFVTWFPAGGDITTAGFEQFLIPTSFNFGGRTLSETFLTDGEDSCHFTGSSVPLTRRGIPDAINLIPASPTKYADIVGMWAERVTYYRSRNRAPCHYMFDQTLSLDCQAGTGNVSFAVVPLYMGVGKTNVGVGRGSNIQSKTWGPPSPDIATAPSNFLLID